MVTHVSAVGGTERAGPEIASIRGLACILLVAYHVVGPSIGDGLRLPDDSIWRYAVVALDFVRMPLFSAISGYLYATRRVTRTSLHGFALNKTRRIIVPLLFMTVLVWLLRDRVYGETTSFLHAMIFHYQHLWFLQALALIFVIVAGLDAIAEPNWHVLCLLAFAFMTAGRSWAITDFLSLNGMIYLMPYFLFGMVLRIAPGLIASAESRIIGLGVFVIVMIDHILGMAGLAEPLQRQLFPAVFCGMAALVVLLQRMPRIPILASVGGFSYTIYLWHPMASATMRALLRQAGVQLVPIQFCLCFIFGVGVPILLHHIVAPIPFLSVVMTGNRRLVRSDHARLTGLDSLGKLWRRSMTAIVRTTGPASPIRSARTRDHSHLDDGTRLATLGES